VLEKASEVSSPQKNRRKVSVNIFTLVFPPQTVLDVEPPRLTQTHLFGILLILLNDQFYICRDPWNINK